MTANLTVGGMFAGYGGLELALQSVLDVHPAWFAEFDDAPSKILAHHWPDVPNLGDVTKINWSTVTPVDILTGGSPCQDVSSAGKRTGMRPGTRSGLWASMCDAIDILRPSLVIWENVRGALSAPASSASDLVDGPGPMGDRDGGHLRALGRVLGDLADVVYDAVWTGLRAADVGAPHGRFRIFVLAWPAADTDRVGLEWAGRARDGRVGPAYGDQPALTLLPTPVVNDMGAGKDPNAWTASMQAKHGNGNGHGASLAIEALRMLPTPRATDGTKGGPNQRGSSGDLMLPSAVQLLPTPTAMDSKASGGAVGASDVTLTDATTRGESRGIDFGAYAPAIARWKAITRPAPSPTEPTGKGGAQRLSPRFVEWMQGLADSWVTGVDISRNDQLKALGNGVVPQQGAAAIRHLLTVRHAVLTRRAA